MNATPESYEYHNDVEAASWGTIQSRQRTPVSHISCHLCSLFPKVTPPLSYEKAPVTACDKPRAATLRPRTSTD